MCPFFSADDEKWEEFEDKKGYPRVESYRSGDFFEIGDAHNRMRTRLTLSMVLLLSVLAFPLPLAATQRIVFDQLGRRVSLPGSPQRIVSLAPSITEVVFAIGQGHRLRGVTRYSDYPPEARRLPTVGSYVHLDLEKIVALRPDLCIATKDGNPKGVVERLEQLGIPVYAVDPRDSRSVMQTVEEIGDLLGAGEAARRLAADMRAQHRPGERPGGGDAFTSRGFFSDRHRSYRFRGDPDLYP